MDLTRVPPIDVQIHVLAPTLPSAARVVGPAGAGNEGV